MANSIDSYYDAEYHELRYKCPLCGKQWVMEYEICDVCNWENELIAYENPDYDHGVNHLSLNEAKQWYAKYGKSWPDVWWKKLKEHYDNFDYDAWVKAWPNRYEPEL